MIWQENVDWPVSRRTQCLMTQEVWRTPIPGYLEFWSFWPLTFTANEEPCISLVEILLDKWCRMIKSPNSAYLRHIQFLPNKQCEIHGKNTEFTELQYEYRIAHPQESHNGTEPYLPVKPHYMRSRLHRQLSADHRLLSLNHLNVFKATSKQYSHLATPRSCQYLHFFTRQLIFQY